MEKSTKIIASLLGAIVVVLAVVIVITTTKMKEPDSNVTVAPQSTAATVSAQTDATVAPSETSQVTTTEPTTTAPAEQLSELILGKWTDSANMSGYEFFADGTVEMTYVNLTVPVINIPINGVSKGVYTLEGDVLTTKFSIYSATIDNTYTVSVENNSLTMKNREDGDASTYSRAASSAGDTTTTQYVSLSDEIIGSWVNDNGSVKYAFGDDGTVKVGFVNANVTSVSTSVLNGEYAGIYLTDGSSVIIQFTVNGQKITQKFTFSVSKNTLGLTDETGSTDLYAREGTGALVQGSNALIGKWSDGTGMSGYSFKEGGVVDITYVNLTIPVINMPINGTFTGSYSISGDSVTISYSIYGKAITDTFEYIVDSNSLTLISPDGDASTYVRG